MDSRMKMASLVSSLGVEVHQFEILNMWLLLLAVFNIFHCLPFKNIEQQHGDVLPLATCPQVDHPIHIHFRCHNSCPHNSCHHDSCRVNASPSSPYHRGSHICHCGTGSPTGSSRAEEWLWEFDAWLCHKENHWIRILEVMHLLAWLRFEDNDQTIH